MARGKQIDRKPDKVQQKRQRRQKQPAKVPRKLRQPKKTTPIDFTERNPANFQEILDYLHDNPQFRFKQTVRVPADVVRYASTYFMRLVRGGCSNWDLQRILYHFFDKSKAAVRRMRPEMVPRIIAKNFYDILSQNFHEFVEVSGKFLDGLAHFAHAKYWLLYSYELFEDSNFYLPFESFTEKRLPEKIFYQAKHFELTKRQILRDKKLREKKAKVEQQKEKQKARERKLAEKKLAAAQKRKLSNRKKAQKLKEAMAKQQQANSRKEMKRQTITSSRRRTQ